MNNLVTIDGFCGGQGGCYPSNISYNPLKQNVHPSKKMFNPPPPNIRHNKKILNSPLQRAECWWYKINVEVHPNRKRQCNTVKLIAPRLHSLVYWSNCKVLKLYYLPWIEFAVPCHANSLLARNVWNFYEHYF
jgi:hypothetical protein